MGTSCCGRGLLHSPGRSDLFLKLEVIKKIVAILPIVLGITLGIKFMLWGAVCTSVISFFLNSYYSADLINYPTWKQIKDILPTLLVSGITALAMWSLTFVNMPMFFLLLLQCLLGLVLSIFIYERLRLEEYLEVKHIILSLLSRKK